MEKNHVTSCMVRSQGSSNFGYDIRIVKSKEEDFQAMNTKEVALVAT